MAVQRQNDVVIRNSGGFIVNSPSDNCCCCENGFLWGCFGCVDPGIPGLCAPTKDIEVEFSGIVNGTSCTDCAADLNRSFIFSGDGTTSSDWLANTECEFNNTLDGFQGHNACTGAPWTSGGTISFSGEYNPGAVSQSFIGVSVFFTGCSACSFSFRRTGQSALDLIDELCSDGEITLPYTGGGVGSPPTPTAACNGSAATCTVRIL